jgi:hypothetical protein
MITNIILGYVVPFVLLVIAGYLIKHYRDDNVIKWVKIAVKAAEQIYNGDKQGAEKFEYVKAWISKKFQISEKDLKNLIESAVYEINKEQ